ncbi:MAG: NAD-dependent deacylase [Prevotellaceae bacterium]|jgi:NAD-dependent deacetylase|nr:NAD-dependent deacylase [Prevotellaceae bacterium]
MKKKVVVLSGAGMSAESGINTFRDSGGLWEQHRIEDVATYEGWLKNRKFVLDFYNRRRKQLLTAEPNAGHRELVRLEQAFDVHIITQNVDDLHERAGSSSVLHLHGELRKARSTIDPNYIVEIDGWELTEGMTDPQGAQLRPHIVWFGEAVPMIDRAAELSGQADIYIVVGTSMAVYPAAGLIHYVPKRTPKYIVDPNDVPVGVPNVRYIKEPATVGLKKLVDELKNMDFENIDF